MPPPVAPRAPRAAARARSARLARAASVLLAALVLAPLAACRSEALAARNAGPPPAVESPLERALAAIDPLWIGLDVDLLAADELEGRDTPSRGLRIAARYIVHRLETVGLAPGAERGWYQEWLLVERALTGERSAASLTLAGETLELAYGEDYAVHPTELVDASLEGELVWCGDGSREAFGGLDLEGRIAVCRQGSETRTRRRHRAQDAGAVGLLVVPDPGEQAPPFGEWVERLARPSYHWPAQRLERTPTFWLAGAAAARLLALAAELEPGQALGGRFTARVGAAREVAVENVCGFWPGSDPSLRDEVILVSAHYDHVGVRDGEIYNGADDNASGSAALLALAEALAAHGPLERSVLLLWVSGEERNLLGSRAWAEAPWLPAGGRAICNINFDMVGRNAPDMLEFTPTSEHPEHNGLSRRLVELAPLEGFLDLQSADKDFSRSDHASFAEHLGLPVLYVSAGEHEDYHQASDTADKVDSDKVARLTRLVLRLILELQEPGLDLARAER